MNSEIIRIIESKRNELRRKIMTKGFWITKEEKRLLDKYEELLLEQFSKLVN